MLEDRFTPGLERACCNTFVQVRGAGSLLSTIGYPAQRLKLFGFGGRNLEPSHCPSPNTFVKCSKTQTL